MKVKLSEVIWLFTKNPMVKCNTCWEIVKAKREVQFNWCMFIVLMMLWVIPGIIYMIATYWKDRRICSNCDSSDIIPWGRFISKK